MFKTNEIKKEIIEEKHYLVGDKSFDTKEKAEEYLNLLNSSNFKDTVYYEIENTINERSTNITGRYVSFSAAMEALKTCNNWYRPKDTGCIIECKVVQEGLTVSINRKKYMKMIK